MLSYSFGSFGYAGNEMQSCLETSSIFQLIRFCTQNKRLDSLKAYIGWSPNSHKVLNVKLFVKN